MTTATYNLASLILNVVPVGTFIRALPRLSLCIEIAAGVVISEKVQFSDYVRIKFTSQSINGKSSIL